jgi:hypothetical protein
LRLFGRPPRRRATGIHRRGRGRRACREGQLFGRLPRFDGARREA